MHILNAVKIMNITHSKYGWKNPKQDKCKPNAGIFLKGNNTPNNRPNCFI